MPGVVMDNASIGGSIQESVSRDYQNGSPTSISGPAKFDGSSEFKDGPVHINGGFKEVDVSNQGSKTAVSEIEHAVPEKPFELTHITHGFFPFAKLVNRSAQQCWNDLSDVIAELAEIQVSSQDHDPSSLLSKEKSSGNQTTENVHKKLRILDFAHAARAEFIKLLVLSQWSQRAADVSKLIDVQGFIRTRHQAYSGAVQWVGDMKRDLIRAQVANPDLRTALEVLSKGKVTSMSDLGYKPPKRLTARNALKKLRKIDRIISVRLALHDPVPLPFRTYHVHDGRVTFFVPGEFELDLSIAEETRSSQFFFVDIRFLFSPSSPIPKGRIFNELDVKVNNVLRDNGLNKCFDLLHSLVLSNKISILFRQAVDLANGLWSTAVHFELLHRTLVLQYWTSKPGPKSWIEIGIKSGRKEAISGGDPVRRTPYLGLRWMRDGREVDNEGIEFVTETLSMDGILRSVIALHISHILSLSYAQLCKKLLFSARGLSLRTELSRTEPGDCHLDVQLTGSRHLRVSVEPISGKIVLWGTPTVLERADIERNFELSPADDIVSRVSRVRCVAAMEEIESNAKMLGLETVNPRAFKFDVRRVLSSNILRYSFFWHRLWQPDWAVLATSSMDSDNWWVVQLRPAAATTTSGSVLGGGARGSAVLQSANIVSDTFLSPQRKTDYASFADLWHCLSGILAIHANACYLAELQRINFYPSLRRLKLESGLQVPGLFLRYETGSLPPSLRIIYPTGLRRRQFVKETVRLAFLGIDPKSKLAIMVAYGHLLYPSKAYRTLIPRMDDSLIFQPTGSGFAIRLLAPPGRPVIFDLIERLQKLECVLSILEILQRKRMAIRTLSLTKITFDYGFQKELSANINIKVLGPASLAEVDPGDLVSRAEPLLRLHLGINFDSPNPHRRIQDSLVPVLNNDYTDAGVETAFHLLSITLPLLRALDRITANKSRKEPLRVQVTVRDAKTFQICYPIQKCRFRLTAGQHLNRISWILTGASDCDSQGRTGGIHATNRLQEGLYNSKGDGWRGLGNGAVAEVDGVANLISELDKCFTDAEGCPHTAVSASNLEGKAQPVSAGQTGPGRQGGTIGIQHKPSASNGADVIMFD